MYKKVLVPLDGSERAESILPHVLTLAENHRAKIVFLSVLETPHTIVATDGIYIPNETIVAEHHHAMEEYLKKHQTKFKELGFDTDIRVVYGRVIDEICHVATEENVDLVALASHGRTGLAQVFYGSVAAGILNRIDRPLLIIRAK